MSESKAARTESFSQATFTNPADDHKRSEKVSTTQDRVHGWAFRTESLCSDDIDDDILIKRRDYAAQYPVQCIRTPFQRMQWSLWPKNK